MNAAGLTPQRLAEQVEVDPKSVERWLSQGRVPHARTRVAVARALGQTEMHLWPALRGSSPAIAASAAELTELWPSRDQIPGEVWRSLVNETRSRLEVLVYAGGFIVEVFRLVDRVAELSEAGGTVRILLGDPESEQVVQRGIDEGLPSLPGRAASTLEYLGPVRDLPGVEIRLHSAPLYVSIYRFDDLLMVNPHTHGLPAKDNPVLQLKRLPEGQIFDYYQAAFDRVWDGARPVGQESDAAQD